MRRRFNKFTVLSGQSLIEVVISIAIAALLAISLISTTLITQRTSHSAKNNTEATKLAQEGIELIRVFRDRQGYSLLTDSTCFYLEESTSGNLDTLGKYPGNCPSSPSYGELIQLSSNVSFYRTYAVAPAANAKLVTVTVEWDEPGGRKKVENETFLSQWESF